MEKVVTSTEEYFNTYNHYLANALAWMGLHYLKFQDVLGNTYYSFSNTQELQNMFTDLKIVRQKHNKYFNNFS